MGATVRHRVDIYDGGGNLKLLVCHERLLMITIPKTGMA